MLTKMYFNLPVSVSELLFSDFRSVDVSFPSLKLYFPVIPTTHECTTAEVDNVFLHWLKVLSLFLSLQSLQGHTEPALNQL